MTHTTFTLVTVKQILGGVAVIVSNPKQFYIAGSFRLLILINDISQKLENKELIRTYDWSKNTQQPNLDQLHDIAEQEYQGLINCDFFVFIFPGGKGSNVEFGIATALHKRIYILDTTGKTDDPEETSSFYLMEHVSRFHGTANAFTEFILNKETD